MAKNEIHYANWWSKLLFKKSFENQFIIPIPPPAAFRWLLKAIEKSKFDLNFDTVQIDRPVFIVGLPRSGTSLLYNLLCAHESAAFVTNSINSFPDAICAMEWIRRKFNLNIRGERFLQDSIDADFGSPSEPIMFWGKWIGREPGTLFWPEKRLRDFSKEKIQEIYTDIRRIIYSSGDGDRRFICKYPVFQTELRLINDLFPDARFIHIIRDGRQTANSLVKLHKLTNDQLKKIKHPLLEYLIPYPRTVNLQKYVEEYGADDIRCTARVWQESIDLVNSVKNELSHFTEVRYEDLLKDPKKEMGRLFEFAELSWPKDQNVQFKEEMQKVGVIHHKNNYGQYEIVEQIAGRTLRELGYLR